MLNFKDSKTIEEQEKVLLAYGLMIYRDSILPRLEKKYGGCLAFVDLETGDYVVSRGRRLGKGRLKRRSPGRLVWIGTISFDHPSYLKAIEIMDYPKRGLEDNRPSMG